MTEKGGCPGFEPQPGHQNQSTDTRWEKFLVDCRKDANKVLQWRLSGNRLC